MKHTTWGILAGGAVAAAFLTSATANADTWTPVYDTDHASLLGSTDYPFTGVWELPATFTQGTTTLTGIDFLTPSAGGFNDEFVTSTGAIYDQDQLGGGFTNLYYDSGVSGAAPVDMLKTPFGTYNISSMASLFTPEKYSDASVAVTSGYALQNAGLFSALDLGLAQGATGDWSVTDYGDTTAMHAPNSLAPVWEQSATFTHGATTLTGTDYVSQSLGGYNDEFVTSTGAIYDQDQLFPGVTNLYYDADPGATGDHVVDMLKTPFGTFDASSLASWFAPEDVSNLVVASPLTDLQDAGLYSALDLASGITP